MTVTPADAARLLTFAASWDRRTIGEVDAKAWADSLHDLDPADCIEAIRIHNRTSTAYLMPAHVRQLVKSIRAMRIETQHNEALMRMLDEPKPDKERSRANYLAALAALPDSARTSDDGNQDRGNPCPYCGALAGEPCINSATGQTARASHPSRVDWTPEATP